MQFKSALITTDFSETAQSALRFIATRARAEKIILFSTVEDWTNSPFYAHQNIHLELYKEAREKMLSQAQNDLEKLAKKYFKNQKIECLAALGKKGIAQEIVKAAREKDVEAIVMASTGRGKLGQMFMGSIVQKVIHLSTVPVVVLGQKYKPAK